MPAISVVLGRQSGTNQLQVSANNNVIGTIGQIGSVDNGVSRQHLKFSVDTKSLEITITNLSPLNQTKVNGSAIVTSKISLSDRIELGMNSYLLDQNSVVQLLQREALVPKEYSIKHLEPIWNNYYDTNRAYIIKQGRLNAIFGLGTIFTLGSFLAAAFMPHEGEGLSPVQIGGYCLAILFAVITAVVRYKGATLSVEKKEALEHYLQSKYICPKKECGHFLGNKNYSILLQDGKCPYCGSKFKE